MRICMVTHSLYESDGRVMRYAEALAARGDQVDVIALRKEGKPREETIAGVRVFRVHKRAFNEKQKAAFLKGVLLFFLRAAWLLTRRHLRQPYDLLHIHSLPDFVVFTALIRRLMGAKLILDIHDIMPELYSTKFGVGDRSLGFRAMLFLERASASFSDHVIIANHIWRERLVARSVQSGNCTVFLNYPDFSIFRRANRDRTSGEFILLYPGTLNQHQGLDVAIRAFAKIAPAVPHAVFHIHGEGRTQDVLMRLVEELGMQGRVVFKPMLPIRQIAGVMANADLAVVAKRKNSFGNEAFSTKILEFMASGVPVIVSNTKIDQHYFNDSVVKFFRDGDEDDLARTMLLLINDAGLRERMAANASEFIRSFDWERKKALYISLVDSLVYGGRPIPEDSDSEQAAKTVERAIA
jgi:glycosyltransferase involved in cell wall biosynthesis